MHVCLSLKPITSPTAIPLPTSEVQVCVQHKDFSCKVDFVWIFKRDLDPL